MKHLLIMTAVLCSLFAAGALAETEGDWEYTVSGGSAAVIGYSGDSPVVTVPETLGGFTVTALGGNVFNEWEKESVLTEITLPSGLTRIGNDCLCGCRSLRNIFLAPGNTAFTEKDGVLFQGNTLLRFPGGRTGNYTVPPGINEIGYAFHAAGITSLTLPESMTAIGFRAFINCEALVSVTLPSSLVSIAEEAFYGCSSLKEMRLGKSVATIENGAFYYCGSLVSLTLDEANPNFDMEDGLLYTASGELIFCAPDQSGTVNVRAGTKAITLSTGYGFPSGVTQVNLPEGLTEIGRGVFSDLTGLKSIRIPSTVTEIGEYAFSGSGLETVTLPDGLTEISASLFAECGSLTSVGFPSSLKTIGIMSFIGCKSLTDTVLPASVEQIGGSAFVRCSSMTDITMQEGLQTIGSSAFVNSGLLRPVIPRSVQAIGADAFEGIAGTIDVYEGSWAEKWANENGIKHTVNGEDQEKRDGDFSYLVSDGAAVLTAYNGNEKSIRIPSLLGEYPVKSIGNYAFTGSVIESVVLPEGLTDIGDHAFSSGKLQQITVPSSLKKIGDSAFSQCRFLSEFRFPEGLQSIGSHAFENCEALTDVSLPDGLKGENIGAYAFYSCAGIATVKLPSGLKYLNMRLFNGCENLRSVDLPDGASGYNCAFGYCPRLVVTVGKNTEAHRYLDWVNGGGVWHVNYRFRGEECENHTWDEGEVIEATCLTEGQVIYTCTVCHEAKTEKIPKKEHVTEERVFYDFGTGGGQIFTVECLRDPERIAFFRRVLAEYENTQVRLERRCTLCNTVLASEQLSFPRLPGDANADGRADILDALLIMRFIDGAYEVKIDDDSADVNGDGWADRDDAMLILQADCGWNVTLE